MPSKDDVSRYHALMRDPTRRRIIEILGEQSKIGFKELRSSLGLGVGTVYYHLDMLSDFLVQDKNRKYMLNDRGQLLYKSMKEGTVSPALNAGEAVGHHIGRWLFLSPVFFMNESFRTDVARFWTCAFSGRCRFGSSRN